MLHEILISLSGYSSDIWEKVKGDENENEGLHDYVTKPEKAMLEVLAHLSSLHIKTREQATYISIHHSATICRAVGSTIISKHLADFQKKILEVESSILRRDAGYVGAYDIVPLSTIVGEFSPWTRRLEFILTVTDYAIGQTDPRASHTFCTGKQMLDFLQSATLTGYSDIEDMATQLLIVGQKVWMCCLASWVLYGLLPIRDGKDFMIQLSDQVERSTRPFTVEHQHIPKFVHESTSELILSVGTALNQIKSRTQNNPTDRSQHTDTTINLRSAGLKLLESLTYPLNASILDDILVSIDASISQIALSQLLPVQQILGILEVIRRYILLGNGEFSMSLVRHADERVVSRLQNQKISQPVRKVGRIDDLVMKDPELNSILARTWSELASLQLEEGPDDEAFVLARKVLSFRVWRDKPENSDASFLSTILPVSATLDFNFPSESALPLFLVPSDIRLYSQINGLLLSLRRSEIHVSDLWMLTPQRRCHPTPLGPPMSSGLVGKRALTARRTRDARRNLKMRQHWSTCSKIHFLVSELGYYYHAEIISNSWTHFIQWLENNQSGQLLSSNISSRPATATSEVKNFTISKSSQYSQFRPSGSQIHHKDDPRVLALGHHAFLKSIHDALLLDCLDFLSTLNDLLIQVDHYLALFSRLQSIWEGLDLQEDDGVVDAFSNYAQEETDLYDEMGRSRAVLEDLLINVVVKIREAEHRKALDDVSNGIMHLDLRQSVYVPWKARTLDRLMMRLDCLSRKPDQEQDNADLMTSYDDE